MLSSQDLTSAPVQLAVLQGLGAPVLHVVGGGQQTHVVGGGPQASANGVFLAASGQQTFSLGLPIGVLSHAPSFVLNPAALSAGHTQQQQQPLTLLQVIQVPSQCQQVVVPSASLPAQLVLPRQDRNGHDATLNGAGDGADEADGFPDDRTISQMDAITRASDGIDLDEIRDLVRAFKEKRVGLGLTQTQVGQDLEATTGVAYSQSAVCRLERLDITPRQAQALRPVLAKWLATADQRYCYLSNSGSLVPILFNRFVTGNAAVAAAAGGRKRRQKRTTFAPETLRALNQQFESDPQPNAWRMGQMAKELGVEYKTVRVWFCNKRQLLRSNSFACSKGSAPPAPAGAEANPSASSDIGEDLTDVAEIEDSNSFDSAAFEMALQFAELDAQSW